MSDRRKLTPHFHLSEFDSHDGKRVPLHLESGILLLCQWWLEPMRSQFGAVTVYSGYRSPMQNAKVNGARSSVHLGKSLLPNDHSGDVDHAAAADVVCARGSVEQWWTWATHHRDKNPHLGARGRGGVGYYPRSRFVHLDTWSSRDWRG